MTSIIGSLQHFHQRLRDDQRRPGSATLMYGLYIYQNAFAYLKMGYACALAWVLFGVILVLTWAQFRGARVAGCTTRPSSGRQGDDDDAGCSQPSGGWRWARSDPLVRDQAIHAPGPSHYWSTLS